MTEAAVHTGLTFGVATTWSEAVEAWRLVYRNYRQLGIIDANELEYHTTSQALTNDSVVIRGTIRGEVASTISGYLDHPVHGLPLDSVYGDELNDLRTRGKHLIEVGLFADRRLKAERHLEALLELIRWVSYFGINLDHSDCVVGVHPHHVRFYERLLGFIQIGETKNYDLVNDAPVVLLYLDWQTQIQRDPLPRALRDYLIRSIPSEAYLNRADLKARHQRSVA